MRVDAFDYILPEAQIATRPLPDRSQARLLVIDGAQTLDKTVADLPEFISKNDLLVLNNTKVMPARLFGQRGLAKVELLLHRARADGTWEAFAKPMKRLHTYDVITFADDFSADVLGRAEERVAIRFKTGAQSLGHCLEKYGHMPLPHYMKREDDQQDRADYQSIFAQKEGAVAAPTASLHFTPALRDALQAKGVAMAEVTLHVGAGTFQPVRVDDTEDHIMHAEWIDVPQETVDRINDCRARGGRVFAVGTTVLRSLESAAAYHGGTLKAYSGDTRLFITPPYDFKVVDVLMTNFHLPRSTLYMLVSAFIGLDRAQSAYQHAINAGYRFYSYGDTSLLFKKRHIGEKNV